MAFTWKNAQEFYYWILDNGDPRTDPWPLVYSPLPVIFIFTLYLVIVAAGPHIMQKLEPLRLKAFLVVYNLSMVLLSVFMFYEFLMTSFLANYNYLCQPVDYSQSELGMRMARVCWWFFFSKVIELLDTILFILRKKNEQVTFLHVYHHGTMLFNWWAGVKYVPGGQEIKRKIKHICCYKQLLFAPIIICAVFKTPMRSFFIGMLNSFVHIFMYLYYGLASLGPKMQSHLWWKRYLTILQLFQFVAIAIHSSYNLFTECLFPDGFNLAVSIYILSLIVLFLNFYYWTYIKKQKKAC